jgi:hypothetical protein
MATYFILFRKIRKIRENYILVLSEILISWKEIDTNHMTSILF